MCYILKRDICPAYVSKHNLNCEKQVILLMIPNGKVWFYCLNCLHSFRTKNTLKSHRKVCENKDFCNILMPLEDTKILEFN